MDQLKTLVLAAEPKPLDILKQESLWERLSEHPKIVVERRGARVFEAPRMPGRPEPSLAKRLARWTTNKHVRLTSCNATSSKKLRGGCRGDVAVNDRPSSIRSYSLEAA